MSWNKEILPSDDAKRYGQWPPEGYERPHPASQRQTLSEDLEMVRLMIVTGEPKRKREAAALGLPPPRRVPDSVIEYECERALRDRLAQGLTPRTLRGIVVACLASVDHG